MKIKTWNCDKKMKKTKIVLTQWLANVMWWINRKPAQNTRNVLQKGLNNKNEENTKPLIVEKSGVLSQR